MIEIWKDIKECEGYQVSNLGRIKRLKTFVKKRNNKYAELDESILKLHINNNGYSCVYIKKKGYLVHRLVYEAFVGEIPEGMQVNHIDEKPNNNRLENLNLLTPKANSNWGTRNERISKNKTNGITSKPVLQYDLEGNFIKEWPSVMEIERVLNFNHTLIGRCCSHKKNYKTGYVYKTGYGYKWEWKKFTT